LVSHSKKKKHEPGIFENMTLKRIFEPDGQEVTEGWRK
jgi:hypothetical protein